MASSIRSSLLGLKAGPSKLLAARFCWKLSGVKWSAQMRECFVGTNDSLFIFTSHFFRSFVSSGNLNVLTFDLELLLQLIAAQNTMVFSYKRETLLAFNFPALFTSPIVTSRLLFPTNSRQLTRPLYENESQKEALFNLQYLCDTIPDHFETSEYVYFVHKLHISIKFD